MIRAPELTPGRSDEAQNFKNLFCFQSAPQTEIRDDFCNHGVMAKMKVSIRAPDRNRGRQRLQTLQLGGAFFVVIPRTPLRVQVGRDGRYIRVAETRPGKSKDHSPDLPRRVGMGKTALPAFLPLGIRAAAPGALAALGPHAPCWILKILLLFPSFSFLPSALLGAGRPTAVHCLPAVAALQHLRGRFSIAFWVVK